MELTYSQVAKRWKCSEKTVRRRASKKVPAWRRLKVIRRGHRTVVIPESSLIDYDLKHTHTPD